MKIVRPCGTYVSGAMVIIRWPPGRRDVGTGVVVVPLAVAASCQVPTLCLFAISIGWTMKMPGQLVAATQELAMPEIPPETELVQFRSPF